MIEKYEKPVALICMEELDEPLAKLIRSSMRHWEKTRIFSSREYNASRMTSILRSLELLVTSRYHAGVLSLDAAVPQTAIGHDQRLRDLYRDLEIYDGYFLEHTDPQLFQLLEERADKLMRDPAAQRELLHENSQIQHARAKRNAGLLSKLMKGEEAPDHD
jgi:polysaccharide pyruvyl transferase WcaK-like protein